MSVEVKTSLLTGGLDLVTPPISMPPGKVISAINYSPDVAGYTRIGGYERFDGHPRPSDATVAADITARRTAIGPVPGTGPVRGVWVFNGNVYAFRDQALGGGMFKASAGGWALQSFGSVMPFTNGSHAFVVGEYLVGTTSAASAYINRVILRSGTWSGSATGYLVLSSITGTFASSEPITSTSGGAAVGATPTSMALQPGGKYDFTNHNFYGSLSRSSMYFVNGVDSGYEWNGTVLSPIITGSGAGTVTIGTTYLLGTRVLSPVTMTIATPCVVTTSDPLYTVHGFSAGQPLVFTTTGALPTGVTAGTTYYVIAAGLTTTAFQFSATPGGAAINTSGTQSGVHALATSSDFILGSDGSSIIFSAGADTPTFISHYKNHLFLGYTSGSLINSSIGEPLEYITTTGAGEISFGDQITGLLTAASTSLVVFAQNRIEYLTGDDATSFVMNPISDASGAKSYTVQMMDSPMFLDDGGIHALATTASFGDWRMASATQAIEPLIAQKRDTGVAAIAAMRIKAKDQYRMFWNDGSGITIYIGRKYPETLPFKIPIDVFCACSGEVEEGHGDRLFVGCQDGFVYEMERGTSFDGAVIDSHLRLPFASARSPMEETRWMKATFELSTPDDIMLGVAFDTDYARGLGGANTAINVSAGAAMVGTDYYSAVDWTRPVEGRLEYHLAGIGPNIATLLTHSSATTRPHTVSTQTYNYSRRRLKR